MTQIFLVTQNAGGQFPDPGNWGLPNSVEVIGSGGYGGNTQGTGCTVPPCRASEPRFPGELVYEWDNSPAAGRATGRVGRGPQFVWRGTVPWTVQELNWTPATDPDTDVTVPRTVDGSASGAGGGGYGKGTNLSPTFPWPYYVQGTMASSGNLTYFTIWGQSGSFAANPNPPPQNPGWVWAGCGRSALDNGAGGTAGWPTGFAGGAGGAGSMPNFTLSVPGGGGGGAAGPHGAGAAGQAYNAGAAGGAADGGTVAGGAAGSPGNSGTQFDATHGAGSGGGGGTSAHFAGLTGGGYGGGAGGSYADPNGGGAVQTPGAPSIIVITYNPNSLHYGIVRGVTSKSIYMTVKPDVNAKDDKELDNPAWLQLGGTVGGEALQMLKVDRLTYNSWTSYNQLVAWVAAQP